MVKPLFDKKKDKGRDKGNDKHLYIMKLQSFYKSGDKMQGKSRVTPSSAVDKQKVELDIDAVNILNGVREEIQKEGKSGITYSVVIRWLAVKAGIREGTM